MGPEGRKRWYAVLVVGMGPERRRDATTPCRLYSHPSLSILANFLTGLLAPSAPIKRRAASCFPPLNSIIGHVRRSMDSVSSPNDIFSTRDLSNIDTPESSSRRDSKADVRLAFSIIYAIVFPGALFGQLNSIRDPVIPSHTCISS